MQLGLYDLIGIFCAWIDDDIYEVLPDPEGDE